MLPAGPVNATLQYPAPASRLAAELVWCRRPGSRSVSGPPAAHGRRIAPPVNAMVHLPAFNVMDAVVAVILLMGALGGLKRGLSGELSRMAAVLIAVLAGWKLAAPCAEWAVEQLGASQDGGFLIAFILIAVLALVALWLLRKVLRNVMDFAFKGRLEKVGGAVCGTLRAALIAACLLLALGLAPQPDVQRLVAEQSCFGRLTARHLRPLYEDLRARRPELGLPDPAQPRPVAGDEFGESAGPLEDEVRPGEPGLEADR